MTYRLPTLTSSSPTPRVRLEEVTASQLEISSLTSPFRGSREANSRLSVRDPRCTLDRSLRTLRFDSAIESESFFIPFLFDPANGTVRTPSRTSPKGHIQQGIDVLYVVFGELPRTVSCGTGFFDRQKRNVATNVRSLHSLSRVFLCLITERRVVIRHITKSFCQLVFETKLARLLDI